MAPPADVGARQSLARLLLACVACVCVTACGAGGAAGSLPGYELRVSRLPGAGLVLTDGHGFSLYIYTPDHRGRSQCSAVCARDWPPLTLPAGVRHAVAGRGVRASLLGTVRRPGGARQVTYNGWPLYLWQGDHEPGQATGQADDMGLWYLLSPSGSINENPVSGQGGD
jgi:predicted lipoprotein with Yx(FWY)xxD motif